MANLKSTYITNRDAKVLTDATVTGANVSEAYGWVFTGAADAAGSTYRLCNVPSDCRLTGLSMTNTSLGSGCLLDVAVFYPTTVPTGGGAFLAASLGAALVSSSAFATAIAVNASNTNPAEQFASAYTIPLAEQPLWQALGLANDPESTFDIGFTVRIATAAAGYVALRAKYAK